MQQPAAVTPMAFVRCIALAFERRGMDPAPALAAAQITPAQLQEADARITALQMEAVSAAAMQALDDEALGWFSRRLPWGSYGMLCRASTGAATLGLALKRWCRHHRLLTEDVLLRLEVLDDTARLSITEQRDFGPLREFCLVTLLRYVHGYACWAVDSRIPLLEASFPFPAPPHAAAYDHMFPGPVRFGADAAGFSFDARYLALPLRRDEAALNAMLKRALPLTVRQYRRDRLLAQRVRERLRQQPGATADEVAAALFLSTRSLHRQLQEESTTLQALKDAVRRDIAVEQLLRSNRPIKQIAQAAGFDNEKSFTRAFKGWTGESPAALRQRSKLSG
ncbi:AraC family transcriptional regulator [Azohydromonas caseinilytica]|uniref:AraC family transcriptional regulator n=1 Tax=Azohydromonas caseinilytica TaxID=2728836 RepID=A0A848F9N6_9BURK|nr:AraC family transcriptional regulator [Azohydromonas caseinilytica]NML15445.1 AraC family transcriptional regulator [Azohydromonas caseinilytica]